MSSLNGAGASSGPTGSNAPSPFQSVDDFMAQDGITKAGSSYAKQVKLSDGREITVTLNYTGDVTDKNQLQTDMQKTTQKMIKLAEEMGLGQSGKALFLEITKLSGKASSTKAKLIVGYENPQTKEVTYTTGSKIVKTLDHTNDADKITLLQSIHEIFTDIVESSSPVISSTSAAPAKLPCVEAAETAINALIDLEKKVLKNKLACFLRVSQLLDDPGLTKESFEQLKGEKNQIERDLYQRFNEKKQSKHKAVVNAFTTVQKEYNNTKNADAKIELGKEIDRLNRMLVQMNISTSKLKAIEGQVMSFAAVVEKKLDLIEKILESSNQGPVTLSKKEIKEKDKEKIKIGREAREINKIELETIATNLMTEIDSISSKKLLYSLEEAKEKNKPLDGLEIGSSHLNIALESPMNWTPIYSATLLFSKEGNVYTSETVLTPIGLGDDGKGVPAGLREQHKTKPTNLFKTEHSVLDDEGRTVSTQVSFRGGQFPNLEAAKIALRAILGSSKVDSIHINSLLTPTALTRIKKDRALLETHKAKIVKALNNIIGDKPDKVSEDNSPVLINNISYTKDELRVIRDKLVVSNFGVNEGAVGQIQAFGKTIPLKMGWHTATALYNDPAVNAFNDTLSKKLGGLLTRNISTNQVNINSSDKNKRIISHLGAIVHVGLELEKIWALNGFADAKKGNDQFKQAAYWKVMDMLLGTTSYTNCMSGKDRTGEVESAAQRIYSEIMMNMEDHKQKLLNDPDVQEILNKENDTNNNNDSSTQNYYPNPFVSLDSDLKNSYTLLLENCSLFTKDEFLELLTGISNDNYSIKEIEKEIIKKIEIAKEVLNQGKLLTQKGTTKSFMRNLLPNTFGIPTTTPLLDTKQSQANNFPNHAPISNYSRKRDTNFLSRHLEAKNRRVQMVQGSMQVTGVNTSKVGFKLEITKHLARQMSGFDRAYVKDELLKLNLDTDREKITELLGLKELDDSTKFNFKEIIVNILREPNQNKKENDLGKILKKIEYLKAEAFHPQAKVKD